MQSEEILRENTLFNSDLYQFTCSYSYFMSNKHEQEATFEVFFRKYPFGGKYVIFGGLRSVKDFFNNLSFTVKEEEYLKNKFPHMKQEYFTWLKENMKLSKIKIKCKLFLKHSNERRRISFF